MTNRRSLLLLAALLCLGTAACSQDAPLADPGGMGAGRPDTSGAAEEEPAMEVLEGMDIPPAARTDSVISAPVLQPDSR